MISSTSIESAVAAWASKTPDRLAVRTSTGSVLSYAELDRKVNRAAAVLANVWEIEAGDRVLLRAGRGLEFVVGYLATHRVGAVAVPLAPELPDAQVKALKERVAARHAFSSDMDYESLASTMNAADDHSVGRRAVEPESLADIMFTSGTTGRQKAVPLTHSNLMGSVANINSFIGTDYTDIEVIALPLSHSFGLGRLRCCLAAGASVVVGDGFARPKQLFATIQDSAATGFSMVPAAWKTLKRLSGTRLGQFNGQFKYIELGSSWMSEVEKRELSDLFPNSRVIMHYGLTEASRATFLDFGRDSNHLKTVGRAGPAISIQIMSADGKVLGTNCVGEICIQGPMVTSRYLDDEELNERSFFGTYFRTGDLGSIDCEGFVTLEGRMDEMINVAGRKVAPSQVEDALMTLQEVADAACVGVDDQFSGQRIKAFVVWRGEAVALKTLSQLLKPILPSYMLPTDVEAVQEIPRTSSGKVYRKNLLSRDDR